MNAKQKKTLKDAISTLEAASLEDLASSIREIAEAERESFDDKSERAQESEKGQAQDALATKFFEELNFVCDERSRSNHILFYGPEKDAAQARQVAIHRRGRAPLL